MVQVANQTSSNSCAHYKQLSVLIVQRQNGNPRESNDIVIKRNSRESILCEESPDSPSQYTKMASGASQTTTLAHRSVASIRTAAGRDAPGGASSAKDGGGAGTAPSSPHTPLRGLSSAFGSPSSLRADEDSLVIDFGSRALRVGLAGDAAPKAVVSFGPEHQRRVGDFRTWELGYRDDWRGRATGELWGKDYELWRFDVRGLDLGLVGDRLERALREAFTKWDLPFPQLVEMALAANYGQQISPTRLARSEGCGRATVGHANPGAVHGPGHVDGPIPKSDRVTFVRTSYDGVRSWRAFRLGG